MCGKQFAILATHAVRAWGACPTKYRGYRGHAEAECWSLAIQATLLRAQKA